MKKRLLAFCLLFTMVCSVWQVPVLADELEELEWGQQVHVDENELEAIWDEEAYDDGLSSSLAEEPMMSPMAADTIEELAWVLEEATIPTARGTTATAVVGNRIYVIGGNLTGSYTATNANQYYDTETKTWSTAAPMPTALWYLSGVAVGEKIYVLGGSPSGSGVGSNRLQIYDTVTDEWSTGANVPVAHRGMSCVAVGTDIYVVANGIYVYDTLSNIWTTKAKLNQDRHEAAACVYYDGKIYLLGGRNGTGSNTMFVYDISSDIWTTGTPMTKTRFGSGYALVGDDIYLMGGSANNQVDIYNITTDTWRQGPAMKASRQFTVSAYVQGTLYTISGYQVSGLASNTMESLQVGESTVTPPPTENRLFVLLNISESVQLSLFYNLGINLDYDWSSTDEAVATVNANGYVTAQGEGTCFIYAENDEGYRDYIPIKVIEGNADEIRLAVHLTVGGIAKLYLAEDPREVTWTSFDDSVVSVDSEGMLIANSRGLAIVQGEINGEEYHIYVRVNA